MESFHAVIRTLLARIRTVDPRSGWPPSAAAVSGPADSLYRVAPTRWGVAGRRTPEGTVAPNRRVSLTAEPAPRRRSGETGLSHRFRLDLSVFGLPVPRGLPST